MFEVSTVNTFFISIGHADPIGTRWSFSCRKVEGTTQRCELKFFLSRSDSLFVFTVGHDHSRRRGKSYTDHVDTSPLILAIQNLFPVQIENVLTASPAIREAAVVSVPDAQYGEVVGAWIVLEEGHHGKITKEDVRKIVNTEMNPQVPGLVPFQN